MDTEELARRVEVRVRLIARLIRMEAPYGTSISALLVLSTLQDHGSSRVTHLAAVADVTQPTMTSLVARLEKSGLVTRRKDASDGRAVEVSITPAGVRRIDEVLEMRASVVAKRLAELEEGDVDLLERALAPLGKLAELGDDEELFFHRA